MPRIQRYSGRVATVRAGEHYGFIGIGSVKKENGTVRGLKSDADVFIHQDDCDVPLQVGLEVTFEVIPDKQRGDRTFRATNVEQKVVKGELVPVGAGDTMELAHVGSNALYVLPTPAQRMFMKPIEPEAIKEVLANRPMPGLARVHQEGAGRMSADEIVRQLMERIFPQYASFVETVEGETPGKNLDGVIREAIADHRALGMNVQADKMLEQVEACRRLRLLAQRREEILRPETLIPIHFVPDLFTAVPVWYFWVEEKTRKKIEEGRQGDDPMVHPSISYFCDLFPTQRWTDTFLMFNRRMRTLADYNGDIIPPHIIARMRQLAEVFDFLVIMTPYHDVAGHDWQDLAWIRSIDPYVVGFVKRVPIAFMVARFSDSGVFPLLNELIADTIAFLRRNSEKLEGFNGPRGEQPITNPFWHNPKEPKNERFCFKGKLGDHLIGHTEQLLGAFDAGHLFDWLRGEDYAPAS